MSRYFGIIVVFVLLAEQCDAVERSGVVIPIQSEIGPVMVDFIDKNVSQAINENAHLIILTINTPGGLLTSTRKIISTILSSPIPVIGYVTPQGGHAASAGTLILYATHIAAMTPGTNVGAAIPVQIGQESETQQVDMQTKVVNDTAALIRSLAEQHGRDLEFAEQSVKDGTSITAQEALERNVINFIAPSLDSLLKQIHQLSLSINEQPYQILTDALALKVIEPDWQTRLLMIITNPTIAFLLIIVGAYGILFEALSGFALILPGAVGLVCALLGLYALTVLPLNFTALILLLVGLALIIAEFFTPIFGGLAIAGCLIFFLGAVMLIDDPLIIIDWWTLIPVTLIGGGFVFGILFYALRDFRRPVATGNEALINSQATVLTWKTDHGYILLAGQQWKAHSSAPLSPGQTVRVTAIQGLIATVSLEKDTP